MSKLTQLQKQIKQLKAALPLIEAQRSQLGERSTDAALLGIRLKLEELEGSGLSLQGERRQATILYSDLSGYTAMSEQLDPEDVESIMNRIKEGAVWIIESLEGTVNQFVGDEVVALFGIPHAHEDDPVRAVRAARELHAMVEKMSEDVEPLLGRPLTMHSGISTGLIVTSTRDDRAGKFGLTGDTVNTGAQILGEANGNEILVSPETQRLIAPYFLTEPMQLVRMEEKTEALVPHRVLGKTDAQSRIEAAEHRGFTRYIGRKSKLRQLNQCLEKALAGQGQFVSITGEAGLGKSRLLYEFQQQMDCTQINVIHGHCQSYGRFTPYLAFLDALRKGGQLGEEDSPRILHEKVIEQVLRIDKDLEPHIPILLHILSIPSKQYPLPLDLSGEDLKSNIQEALFAFFSLFSLKMPLVLVLEDLHWVDDASEEFLLMLIEKLYDFPMLVVVNFRPEYEAPWTSAPWVTALKLDSINESKVAAMVQSIYGVSHLPDGMALRIFEHTGGNPLFIEELCDLLLEQKVISIQHSHLNLEQSLKQISFPETVQAVIRAKIDRLSEDAKNVLRLASVIGREFLRKILEYIFSEKEKLPPSLRYLHQVELIRPLEDLAEMAYQFNHSITQEVTYGTLLIKNRALLHRRVAETIEEHYAERLEEQYEVLARHYSETYDWETTLNYLEMAGDKATRDFSLKAGRVHYWKAIEQIDSHPMTVRQKEKRIEISLKWAKIAVYAGLEEFIPLLKTSLDHAQDLNDEPKLAQLHYWLGQKNNLLGHLKQAEEHFVHCVSLAEHFHDPSMLAGAYGGIARLHMFGAEFSQSLSYGKKAVEIYEKLGDLDQLGYASECLAYNHTLTGNFVEAYTQLNRMHQLANQTGNLTREAFSHFYTGAVNTWQGNWENGIVAYRMSIEIAEPLGEVLITSIANNFIGLALCMLKKFEQGLKILDQNIALMETHNLYLLSPLFYGVTAYAQARAGHWETVSLLANRCLEWAPKSMKGYESFAHFALALEAARNTPNSPLAEQHLDSGIRLCRERGQWPYVAEGLLLQTKLFRRAGKTLQAKEKRDEACQIFAERGMIWWLEQAINS